MVGGKAETKVWAAHRDLYGERKWRWRFGVLSCATCILYLWPALRPGYVLSPADALLMSRLLRSHVEPTFEPANRLLTDVAFVFEPWLVEARRQLTRFGAPLWNPYAGLGAPLFGNVQSGLLCPFQWPYLLTGTPAAFVWGAAAKWLVASWGMFVLVRRLGLEPWVACFAGLAFPLSGFMTAWLLFPLASSAAWLPWISAFGVDFWRSENWKSFWALALVVALAWFGGHPETTCLMLLAATGFVPFLARSRPDLEQPPGRPPTRSLRKWLLLLGSLLIGTSLAAVQHVALWDYLPFSAELAKRSAFDTVLLYPKEGLLRTLFYAPLIIAPYCYGSYQRGAVHVEKALGVENFVETAGGYCGILAPFVLIFALSGKQRYPWVLACGLTLLASWLIGYRVYPFYDLTSWIPGLSLLQLHRALLLSSFTGVLLLALVVQEFPQNCLGSKGALLGVLLASGLGAFVFLAAALLLPNFQDFVRAKASEHYHRQQAVESETGPSNEEHMERLVQRACWQLPRYYRFVGVSLATLTGALALLAVLQDVGHDPRARFLRALLATVILSDLWIFGHNHHPAIPRDHWYPVPAMIGSLRERAEKLPLGGLIPLRILVCGEELPPNSLTVYGLGDLRFYDGMEHQGALDLLRAVLDDPDHPSAAAAIRADTLARLVDHSWRHQLLALLQARWVLATEGAPALKPRFAGSPCWKVALHQGSAVVWELTCTEPSAAWMVSEATGRTLASKAPGESGWRMLVEQAQGAPLEALALNEKKLEFTVELSESRWLILPILALPGWRCRVNGDPLQPVALGGTILAVPLPHGRHRVQLWYSPRFFEAAALITGTGVLLVAGLLGASSRYVQRLLYLFAHKDRHQGNATLRNGPREGRRPFSVRVSPR